MRLDANGAITDTFNFEPSDGSVDGPYGDIVYLDEGPDGALYYLDLGYSDVGGTFGVSKLRRIKYVQSNQAPVVSASASPTSGPTPLNVAFSSSGSSDPEGQPLTYSWNFGDGGTSTAANPSHTYASPGTYQARLTVSDGVNNSTSTPIAISAGDAPVATISSPTDGSNFRAGDVISYQGDGTDPDDGRLPDSAFTWNIDFLHDGHVHPGTPITGVRSGSFTIPTSGHDFSGNTRYRITLTVKDSTGLTSSKSVTIYPTKVNLSFDTVPSGRTIYLDGIAKVTPFVYDTLVGYTHTVEARNQIAGNTSYTFASWSDGGGQQHSITVPNAPQTYTATFNSTPVPTGLVGAWALQRGGGRDGERRLRQRKSRHRGRRGSHLDRERQVRRRPFVQRLLGQRHRAERAIAQLQLELHTRGLGQADGPQRLPDDPDQGDDRRLCVLAADQRDDGEQRVRATAAAASTRAPRPRSRVNQWSHLAAVFNDSANTYTLYLNGTPISTQSETVAPVANSQALVFGQSACSGCGYERWRGLLDEIRIYNRPLSTAEVQADMNTGI